MRTNFTLMQALALIFIGVFLPFWSIQPIGLVSGMPGTDWEVYPYSPRVGELVTFDTTRSGKWANETFGLTILAYSWDFGDGAVANGSIVSHTYTSPGNYTVEMNTTDNTGQWASAQRLLTVTERTPILIYISSSANRPFIGEEITITGNLTDDINGKGVADETVQLAWSTAWWETWHEITSVETNTLGEFSINWRPPENNKYQIRATWTGNSTYPETSSSVIITVIPLGDLVTGFSSNSTITGMNFNLTTQVLTFTASGPDGTSGYVEIKLKKQPEFNPQNITVLMDNQTIPYSVASADENTWLLAISYMHSTHSILVDLRGNTPIPELPSIAILILFFSLVTLAAILTRLQSHKFRVDFKRSIQRLKLESSCAFHKRSSERFKLEIARVAR